MTPPFSVKFLSSLVLTLALFFVSPSSFAHNSSKDISAVRFKLKKDSVEAQFAISFPDTDLVLKFDKNGDDAISPEEIATILNELKDLAAKELEVYFDGHRMTPAQVLANRQESNFEIYLLFNDVPAPKLKVHSTLLRRMGPAHQEFITIVEDKASFQRLMTGEEPEAQLAEYIFTPDKLEAEFTWKRMQTAFGGNDSSATQISSASAFVTFVKAGIHHILIDEKTSTDKSGASHTSYSITDHLLFLIALLVMCERFIDVIKIVTSFTVAHSITLTCAAMNIVSVPGRIVEPLIAATIVYVGVENLLKLKTLRWRWIITFTFGLIHGFGFATAFKEMFGSTGSVLMRILSFNLGVEIGQILIAALVLPIVWYLRKHPTLAPKWVPVTSAIVVLMGAWWLVERIRLNF